MIMIAVFTQIYYITFAPQKLLIEKGTLKNVLFNLFDKKSVNVDVQKDVS